MGSQRVGTEAPVATADPVILPLRVDGTRVSDDLTRVPVRVDLALPEAHRGHLAGGIRVRCEGVDLPGALSADASGRVTGWVEVPALSRGFDLSLELVLGSGWPEPPRAVLDAGAGADAFRVAAWVRVDAPRAEAVQVLAAQWAFAEQMTAFATHDAGCTDGLPTRGFFGAVFDGRHVYFSPQCNDEGRHGRALRYDTSRPFGEAQAWEGRDAQGTDGLVTKGYYGAVFDGRFVYYVPRTDGVSLHSRVLRYDTAGPFREATSWAAFDAGGEISSQGGAFDGRWVYFAPGYHGESGRSGRVLRYDTTGDFRDPARWERHDVDGTGGLTCTCYDGALFDGRHVYFAPLDGSAVIRYDVARPFADPGSWSAFDAHTLPGDPFGMCVGAVFDGRWIYFAPYAHAQVVRYDTARAFADPGSWEGFAANGIGGLQTRGYDGAAFDGRWVYFVPFWEGDDGGRGFHARVLRYDTTRPFADRDAWEAADGAALAPPNPGGFNGAAFDGRFLYMAPWREDDPEGRIRAHGHVLRLDTAAAGARFQLRLADCGHNGGLGGAVPGSAFLVNCDGGVVCAQAHRTAGAGWHHIMGAYSPQTGVELWLDGRCVARGPARGAPAPSALPLAVGALPGGSGALGAVLGAVRVDPGVPGDGWARTARESLREGSGFLRLA